MEENETSKLSESFLILFFYSEEVIFFPIFTRLAKRVMSSFKRPMAT